MVVQNHIIHLLVNVVARVGNQLEGLFESAACVATPRIMHTTIAILLLMLLLIIILGGSEEWIFRRLVYLYIAN